MTRADSVGSELILYRTEDGRTRIRCRFEDRTLWLTQAQMAELFQTSVPNINLHVKAIYEAELAEEATIKSHLIVRHDTSQRRLCMTSGRRNYPEIPDGSNQVHVAPESSYLACPGRLAMTAKKKLDPRKLMETTSEYQEAMGVPNRTAKNQLRKVTELGLLRMVGAGRATHYEVVRQ